MSLETTKEKIIKNNEQISELLRKNEELLREDGFDLPNENFVVGDWYKIKIPSGYIRNTTYFYEKYHLDSIVKEWQVKANIAYSFQLSDFYNYLFNRFNTKLCCQRCVNGTLPRWNYNFCKLLSRPLRRKRCRPFNIV